MDAEVSQQELNDLLSQADVLPVATGDRTLSGEPVLVFVQLPTGPGEGFRYVYLTPDGTVVARAAEAVGPPPSPDGASIAEMTEHINTSVVTVSAPDGSALLYLRHKKVWKSTVSIADADGRPIGEMRQRNVLGKVKFQLEAYGRPYGRFIAHSTRMLGFDLEDADGSGYGRLTKVGSPSYGARSGVAPFAATQKVAGAFVLQLTRRPDWPLITATIPLALDLSMNLAALSGVEKRGFQTGQG
ncbi:hypothetical protein [Actinoallomurus iriomotensis]|uniref:Uncharacterized protein n=1 Tax=Actinoallomurus iriomotensis TaxID=478107 RepID=A0A9W6RDL9_9ACTN|nr:hypothetical protein [Actinoallomurus iriomotensis]GLY72735.1 hypothetical protein Airi01_010020 [Actinoallomurus iriomotensis]